jgi:Lon protease-like protein
MSCNGLEWIQPPSNQSRIPGSYGYYDPPLAIVNELNRLVDRIKRLEEWKESAMAVEREWNPNSLSKMLGGQLGESQRVVIMREVPKLQDRIKRLSAALESIREYWNRDNNERAMEDACWHAINRASEALEAKEANP